MQETGDTFNGTRIPYLYQSPFVDYGDINIRKNMHEVQILTKPEGDVVCCPDIPQWRPNRGTNSCPIRDVRTGIDAGFLSQLRLRGKQQKMSLGLKLALIAIPFVMGAGALIYFVFVK